MIFGTQDTRMTLRRRTGFLVDAIAVTATVTVDRQPSREAAIKVELSGGTTGSGTVTINGTVDGSSDSEVLTFTANGTKITAKLFTAVTSITSTGLDDEATPATITVWACGRDGSPQPVEYDLAVDIPVHIITPTDAVWPNYVEGSRETINIRALLDYCEAWAPRPGDHLDDDVYGDSWLVEHVTLTPGNWKPNFFDCRCKKVRE